MPRRLWSGPDQRRYDRHEATLEIELEIQVEIYGFETESHPFFASGETLNISLSGLLAYLDAPVSSGSVCSIFFRNAGHQVRPCLLAGRVLRCDARADGFVIAVTFDEPLLHLAAETPSQVTIGAGNG